MAWFMLHVAPTHTAYDDTIAYMKELFNFHLLVHWSRVDPM